MKPKFRFANQFLVTPLFRLHTALNRLTESLSRLGSLDQMATGRLRNKRGVFHLMLWSVLVAPAWALDCARLQITDTELLRIAQLSGPPQASALRALLAGNHYSNESVFYFGDRLRTSLRSSLQDARVGESAARLLALIAVPEDVRAIIESPPQPQKKGFSNRWAYSVAASVLDPQSDVEWLFLRKCVINGFDDRWVDAGAIQTLKLIASPRSRAVLEDAQRLNSFRVRSITTALEYINSEPPSLVGPDLKSLAERVAQIIRIGDWKGNGAAFCNESGDKALVDFFFQTISDRFVYTATFHRSDAGWKLRGVRETEQAMIGIPLRRTNPKQ
jgi:hypothetical protein